MRGAALGEIATGGLGAPVAGLLIGMYPGKLNDGEQDFIDRMRAEQMREAPTRVRFTWENDASGNPTPRGWHTPPGKDSVRVRRMEWDSRRQAYTFTTEEDHGITLIWTPDRTGESKPWDTGNQNPVRIPNPVVVDPLPEDTGIGVTTSPTPEEKTFADYILILPVGGVPPIYVYINSDHKYHSPPKGNPPLSAFPDAKKAQAKTPIKGEENCVPVGRIQKVKFTNGTLNTVQLRSMIVQDAITSVSLIPLRVSKLNQQTQPER